MEISLQRSRPREKNIVLLVSMFILSLLISTISVYETSIAFVLPFFVVAFCCGYRYILSYFLGIGIMALLLGESQVLVVSSITFLILQIGVYLKFIKINYIGIILGVVVAPVLYVYQFEPVSIAVVTGLTVLHSYLFIELVPVFIHKSMDVYTPKRWTMITLLVMLCITGLTEINSMYMFILLRFYLLLSIYYLGIQITMPCLLYVGVILVLQNFALKDDVLSILLPCFIYFIYPPTTKLKTTTLYILSHLLLPFFISYDNYYHGIIIISSGLLFLMAPKININKQVLSTEYKEISNRNKLIQKANTFASLFSQLTTVFRETNTKVSSKEYVGYMYENLCSNCSCRDYCYHNNKEMSRLVKLVTKGLVDTYNKEDLEYIKEHCVNPNEYIRTVHNLHEEYHRISRINQENQHLKNDLFYEFSLITDIFNNFSTSINTVSIGEEHIKEHLLGYQFAITYLKKQIISNHTYTLEIGLMNTTKREIMEELIPILEGYLNESLEVVSLQDSMHHLGYTSIVLKHDVNYTLQHGFQQFSLDPMACGDSYTVFHQDVDHYLAISDGMGQGKEAHEESKLTLEVLSKLVINGIGLKDTLDAINTLLKIKNQSDMFTTLDVCNINLSNARAKLIKYGAFNSYHIRNQEIEEIKCNSLPVGIVSKLKMQCYEMALEDEDILIMASDGVGSNFRQIVDSCMPMMDTLHPQEIATLLMDRVLEERNLDDISILALKIIKQ